MVVKAERAPKILSQTWRGILLKYLCGFCQFQYVTLRLTVGILRVNSLFITLAKVLLFIRCGNVGSSKVALEQNMDKHCSAR